ncbi:MAG: cation:proton antiporter [Verrucomicrobiales bacterium]|nr:cation:proton antiporter [Verrucomicrobiales bacterium]
MSGVLLIRDLAVVMLAAGVAAWVCQRLGLSVIVGYLIAGAVIGPYTPPFALVSDLDRVQTLAQLGLVFVMFSVGLNLSLSRIRRLGISVAIATFVGALVVLHVCRLIGYGAGWTATQGLFVAGVLMVSSSAIISKVLDESNLTHERPGQMALGITVLEDVVAVAMLTLLTSLAHLGGGENSSAGILPTLGGLGAFVVLVALVSLLFVPALLQRLGGGVPTEIRTLVVTGLVLALAWVAARMGYSLALGAFVLGAIVGSTRHKADIEDVFEGVRQIFGAVFFVAVGMLVDFRLLGEVWYAALALAGLAVLLRPLACGLGLIAAGTTSRDAGVAAFCLVPLGEFSFIIAQMGVDSGVMPKSFFPVAVGASLLTSLMAPVLTRNAERLADRALVFQPRWFLEWIGFYHAWLTRLQARRGASGLLQLTGPRLMQIALFVLAVSALLLIAVPTYSWALARVGPNWLFPRGLAVIFWTTFGLVVLAPLVAIWRNISVLAMVFAEVATRGTPPAARLRPLLEVALRAVGMLLLAAWLMALLPSGAAVAGATGAVAVMLATVAVLFRSRLIRLQSRLEGELQEQFRRASQSTSASSWSAVMVEPAVDWGMEIDEVTLPRSSAHSGRSLGQLALRQQFGCSVVGIDRQGVGLVNPDASTVLFPGDKLLVLGNPDDLARAARLLGQSAPREGPGGFEELTQETVVIPEGSSWAGRTLRELDLIRRCGVQVGGIRRRGKPMPTPTGADRLEGSDEVLVLGTRQQIAQFRESLASEFEGF